MAKQTQTATSIDTNVIRAAFVIKGTSLRAWCLQNGVQPQNAHKALVGAWVGPKATALVKRIKFAAEIADK